MGCDTQEMEVWGPHPLDPRPGQDTNSALPESQYIPLSHPLWAPWPPVLSTRLGLCRLDEGVWPGMPALLEKGDLTWAKCSCPGKARPGLGAHTGLQASLRALRPSASIVQRMAQRPTTSHPHSLSDEATLLLGVH